MTKKTGIIIGVAAGVILLVLIAFLAARGNAAQIAFLNIEKGLVEVNRGAGWEKATNGISLALSDTIRTGDDGEASVIIYDSAIISLDPGTQVTIAELTEDRTVIQQDTGSTWNKFIGLSGLKDLELHTPTAVATVRGTEFGMRIGNDEDSLVVAEGEVMFSDRQDAKNVMAAKKGEKLVLMKQLKAQMDEAAKTVEGATPQEFADKIMGRIEKRILDADDKDRMMTGVVKSIQRMKLIRDRQIERDPELKQRLLGIEDKQAAGTAPDAKAIQLKEFPVREAGTDDRIDLEMRLDQISIIRPEVLEKLQERADAGDVRAQRFLKMRSAVREGGMESISRVNDNIQSQIELIEELRHDDDMGAALDKPELKEIIAPLIKADEQIRQQIVQSGMLTQEEMDRIDAQRPIKQLIANAAETQQLIVEQRQAETIEPKQTLEPIKTAEPVVVKTAETTASQQIETQQTNQTQNIDNQITNT